MPVPDNVKDIDEVTMQSLWQPQPLFTCMLAGRFPESLSIDLLTAVYKSVDQSDMSNYRGITVGSMIAELFAVMSQQRIASQAEHHPVKDKGQASGTRLHWVVRNC